VEADERIPADLSQRRGKTDLRHSAKTIEIRISGKVQRVGMRNCIRMLAGKLSIKGEVMNLPDGSVMAYATGDPILLEKFISMIYSCPRAVIRDLEVRECSLLAFPDFVITRSEIS
jgi:acylphosphatase